MLQPRDPSNLVDHCVALASSQPEAAAYTWLADGEETAATLSFAALDREARRIAAELEARGLRGERALLIYSPGLEFVAAFVGCLYAGVAAVPMNAPRHEHAVRTMLAIARHAAPGIVLTDCALLTAFTAQLDVFDVPLLATDALPSDHGDGFRPGAVDPDDLAFVQYTSGSTGSPKGVEVTHRNLIRNEQMIREGFGHDASTVFVGWLPLFHDMGLVGNVLQPLFLGIHSVLMAPSAFVQKPVRWLKAISDFRATTSGSPNFGYELCVKRVRPEQLEGLDLSSWKVAYNGSEPIRAHTLEEFVERFRPVGFRREAFYPCYGLAEASLYVTGGPHAEAFRVLEVDAAALRDHRVLPAVADTAERQPLVACGRPWLDQRVLIVEPRTRRPSADGDVGEIWLQGGNVARGYRDLPPDADDPFRATLASGEGPFFRTGDLGFLRDGQLYVTGRLKDVLIVRGQNYYPQDIELAAGTSHPALRVDYTAAFTVTADGEERLVVVQEMHRRHSDPLGAGGAGAAALRDELVGAVRRAVAHQFGLQVWRVALIGHASLPKTSSGKTQRSRCRALWERGELVELGARGRAPSATDGRLAEAQP